jgi:soluble lytic murein transglycosylase-like protein
MAGAFRGSSLVRKVAAAVGSLAFAVILSQSAFAKVEADARAIPDRDPGSVGSPGPLSAHDAARYSHILSLQASGQWAAADREVDALEDRLLVGHMLANRYLDSRGYRPSYSELVAWLDRYGDLPMADRVRARALRARPAGAPPPPQPEPVSLNDFGLPGDRGDLAEGGTPRKTVGDVAPRIAAALRSDKLDLAERLLTDPKVGGRLSHAARAIAAADVANYAYIAGQDQRAFRIARMALADGGEAAPLARWTAGLAAWRLNRKAEAGQQFEALSEDPDIDAWTASAAAFWAARSYLQAGNPKKVTPLLARAADAPRTFYGLIALRLLGREIGPNLDAPTLSAGDTAQVMSLPDVRRAMALAQIARPDAALEELVALRDAGNGALDGVLASLANDLGLDARPLKTSSQSASLGPRGFPVPRLEPRGGFTVDRALLYAIARQESKFDPSARSKSGALGLMQLMPETARYVARAKRLPFKGPHDLLVPDISLAIGQAYIHYLMEQGAGDNLMALAAAYNAGPGNAQRWMQSVRHGDDPLLFVESMPSPQTRAFVERVLAFFWIYQARLGQEPRSLGALATGAWPRYVAQDLGTYSVAKRNARN